MSKTKYYISVFAEFEITELKSKTCCFFTKIKISETDDLDMDDLKQSFLN